LSNIPHTGLSSSVEYQAFADWKNYSEAQTACQEYNSKRLARIKKPDELNQAKNASNYSAITKYWTALQAL